MAVALDRLDVLVFTGGVGEHAAEVRTRAVRGLEPLGIQIDAGRNATSRSDADIGSTGAQVRALVITAREDLEIVREVRALLG